MIENLKLEDLTPFMQMLIKHDMIKQWIEAPNKLNASIHGFNWSTTAYEKEWDSLCDELEVMGGGNTKKYLDANHKKLPDNLKYTNYYQDVELTSQEVEHIWEIRKSFSEYLI